MEVEKGKSFIPRSSNCLFFCWAFNSALVNCFVEWAERKVFFLHSLRFGERLNEESSTGFQKESGEKKLKNIYDTNGFWCALWLRFNILKDTRSVSSGSVAANSSHKNQETKWSREWDVKSAETFFYFSNLYPFFSHEPQRKQLIISHDIILILQWKVRLGPQNHFNKTLSGRTELGGWEK